MISLQSCDKDALVDCEKQCELYQTGFKCDEIKKNYVFLFFKFICFHLFVWRIKIEWESELACFIFHRKQGRNKDERTGTIISIIQVCHNFQGDVRRKVHHPHRFNLVHHKLPHFIVRYYTLISLIKPYCWDRIILYFSLIVRRHVHILIGSDVYLLTLTFIIVEVETWNIPGPISFIFHAVFVKNLDK